MPVQAEKHGSTTVLRIENGAVNALSVGSGFVAEIRAAFDVAVNDASCAAIVIAGAGRMFCGGADIGDFDGDLARVDELRETLLTIEAATKPVVMAIHGMALGGGLEMALAGHHRLAQAGARLGLPEVTLGILPGAGGTQRLPRLIGAGPALDLMLSGKPILADKALELGLIDTVVGGDVVTAALDIITASLPELRPTGSLPVPPDLQSALAAASSRIKIDALNKAPESILDCVGSISDETGAGLRLEAERFAALAMSEASRGLRHAFFGERTVTRIPGLPADVAPRSIALVGVLGGGLMGTGIAIALLNAGLPVIMVEPRAEGRDKAIATVRTTIGRDVEKGRISEIVARRRIDVFRVEADLQALAEVDLVIEAVFEDMSVKEQVFTALQDIVRPETILASNTSTLNLDKIAAIVRDPTRVVGLHFFSPANIMRLLEVVRARDTAPDVLATAMALAKTLGKVGIVSGVCDGFIGNRIFEEYLRQVYFLLEEGALPQQVDAALEAWGMAMGPCRTMDLVGQDIGWAIRKRRAVEQPDRPYSTVVDRICELGRFGQKTGRGIYLYADGRTPSPDPEFEALIVAHSQEIGVERRRIADDEIVSRCLLAMINEGARIVGEGIAFRPIDVDMTLLNGYGFARERGGPLFQADIIGLASVLDQIRGYAEERNGWAWALAPLLEDLASRGAAFADLNG
jgi:3-hydroxyacyl-CoA dehydrogenase